MSSCQVVIQDVSQVFPIFIYLFLELKYIKYWNLLSHNFFLFTFDRKCLKIIAFSEQDGSKMNGLSIGLEEKMTLLQYAIIALKMSVLPIWKRLL